MADVPTVRRAGRTKGGGSVMKKERMTRYEATTGLAEIRKAIKKGVPWLAVCIETTTIAYKGRAAELFFAAGYDCYSRGGFNEHDTNHHIVFTKAVA